MSRSYTGPSRAVEVLMIEDDLDYRRLVEAWLSCAQAPGFRMRFASRLDDAWHRFEHSDLVVLDLGLPDSAGMETLVAARELAGARPIVVLTANDDIDLRRRALMAGADAFVVKRRARPGPLRRTLCDAVERRDDGVDADEAGARSFWIDPLHGSLALPVPSDPEGDPRRSPGAPARAKRAAGRISR